MEGKIRKGARRSQLGRLRETTGGGVKKAAEARRGLKMLDKKELHFHDKALRRKQSQRATKKVKMFLTNLAVFLVDRRTDVKPR